MPFRRYCFFLCIGLLSSASSVHAQVTCAVNTALYFSSAEPMTPQERRVFDAFYTEEPARAARMEVRFSGAQREQFIFAEDAGGGFVDAPGAALTVVGRADIEMGSRKTSVVVMRETARPDVFMVGLKTSSGGHLQAMVTLRAGEQKTLTIPNGSPTMVHVRRLH